MIFLLLLLLLPNFAHAQIRNIIKPQDMGFNCNVSDVCGNGNITIAENTNFIHYSAWTGQFEEEILCTLKRPLKIWIKLDGTYYAPTSTSPIQIVNGLNPQNISSQNVTQCDYNNTPRASWTLKAKTGEACKTYDMMVNTVDWNPSNLFTVTISGNCQTPIPTPNTTTTENFLIATKDGNNYYVDISKLLYFLGIKIVLLILWIV